MLLNERFKRTKLVSMLLCMVGAITVTPADSKESGRSSGFGDVLCLLATMFYALYSTLIWKKLPGEEAGEGKASTALFFGYLGLFNGILLAPLAILLHFTGLQTFYRLTLTQFGLIIGKVLDEGR